MGKLFFAIDQKIFKRKKRKLFLEKTEYFIGLHFQIINSIGFLPLASRIRFAGDSSRTQAQGFGSGGLRQRRG